MRWKPFFWARMQVCSTGILTVITMGLILGVATQWNLGTSKVLMTESGSTMAAATVKADVEVASARGGTLRSAHVPSIGGLSETERATRGRLVESYGRLPMSFEANKGQVDGRVKFLSRGRGYTLFLTSEEAVLALRRGVKKDEEQREKRGLERDKGEKGSQSTTVLRMKLVGENRRAQVCGVEELAGKSNYFIGNDPAKWRTDVPTYARVEYHSVYPGVDLVYYGSQGQLESDFIVAPGADPQSIRLRVEGAATVRINRQGDLELKTTGGEVILGKPVVYQTRLGQGGTTENNIIAGRYVVKAERVVGVEVGSYNRKQPLIIDPVVHYSTYLGGTGDDEGNAIAVDAAGNAYVTGIASSSNFPLSNAFQSTLGSSAGNAFVTKFNAAGNVLVYSTYLGGNGGPRANADIAYGIAVDGAGEAYVTGQAFSTNFPTKNPIQAVLRSANSNAFVTKFNAAGNGLVYSTYLGGSSIRGDYGTGIAVDAAGNAYVTGSTGSSDFPLNNAFQPALGGTTFNAFVTKFSAAGNLVYSTYLGGSGASGDFGTGIAVDAAGNAYVTGSTGSSNFPTKNPVQAGLGGTNGNAFVTKFNVAGNLLVYSTYLGGSGGDGGDGIAVDAAGNAYVTGFTASVNFPLSNAFQSALGGTTFNAFVTKFNAAGNQLVYSTYLGGSGGDSGNGIAVDAAGNAYVTGDTRSANFPTANPLQAALGTGAASNAFVTKFNAAGNALVYSTYLGGSGSDLPFGIAVDTAGNAYVTGRTNSTNFPTANAYQATYGGGFDDAFVAKIFLPALVGDFDGDGRADVAVWRPSDGTWYVIPSNTPSNFLRQQWGTAGDIPVPGDYDGDGVIDMAVFRASSGTWFVIPSNKPGTATVQQWGTLNDVPVPGDYDGDGKTDFAVWRPSTGTWFIIPSSNPTSFIITQWGTVGDIPVPGDYDGDGKTDLAVWRPSNGTWFIIPSSNPSAPIVRQWGTAGDIPVPGNYDGDGTTDFAVWRPSNGVWFIIPSSNPNGPIIQQWGTNGDIPVPADYDRDAKTDIAVWRPSNGVWYIIPSSAPSTFTITQWGTNGDVPVQKPIGQ